MIDPADIALEADENRCVRIRMTNGAEVGLPLSLINLAAFNSSSTQEQMVFLLMPVLYLMRSINLPDPEKLSLVNTMLKNGLESL